MTKTNGWPSRMGFLLDEVLGRGNVHLVESSVYRKDQAVLRLLLVEVALARINWTTVGGHAAN